MKKEKKKKNDDCSINYGMADSFMAIFGFYRVNKNNNVKEDTMDNDILKKGTKIKTILGMDCCLENKNGTTFIKKDSVGTIIKRNLEAESLRDSISDLDDVDIESMAYNVKFGKNTVCLYGPEFKVVK